MSKLMDDYEAAYGLGEKLYLRMLGGNPEEIAADLENLDAQNAAFFAGMGMPEKQCTAADLHNEIIKDIQRRYFSAMPREQALAVCNALNTTGEFSPCAEIDELKYNAWTLRNAWNATNPGKDPIMLNPEAFSN